MPKRYLIVYVSGAILVGIFFWLSSVSQKNQDSNSISFEQDKPKVLKKQKNLPSSKLTTRAPSSNKLPTTTNFRKMVIGGKGVQRGKKEKAILAEGGTPFDVADREYKFLPGLKAVPEGRFPGNAGHQEMDRRIGHVFFQRNPDSDPPDNTFAVAINEKTQLLAVVTGRIKVRIQADILPERLGEDFDMKLVRHFSHLHLAFFTCDKKDTFDLIKLVESLKNDVRVERADVELIESRMVAQ